MRKTTEELARDFVKLKGVSDFNLVTSYENMFKWGYNTKTAVKRLEEEKRLLNRSYREIISEKRQLEKELKLVIQWKIFDKKHIIMENKSN